MNASPHTRPVGYALLAALGGPLLAAACLALSGCSEVTNNPHPPGSEKTNTIFVPLLSRSPKYLDPTSSYSNDETPFTYQIYEPLYGYHYLKRPYELVGRTAEEVAHPIYLDKDGKVLDGDAPGEDVAETQFIVKIKPGILYAPHPAFAKNANGEYVYHNLKKEDVADMYKIIDFKESGTRELVADDYVYAIRRLATPRVKSPSFSTMAENRLKRVPSPRAEASKSSPMARASSAAGSASMRMPAPLAPQEAPHSFMTKGSLTATQTI